MGLWVNLGFVLFIILAVLSGNVRAEERPLLTPFTVCPLENYRATGSQQEFVSTGDTLYIPHWLQLQVFNHPVAVKQAVEFTVAVTQSKRIILQSNQRQIRTLLACMNGVTGKDCADPDMVKLVNRYMGHDLKKGLGLFRVFEALAFRPTYEDLYVIPAFWNLESQINYKLENMPGMGLIKAKQEPLTPVERKLAEDMYFEWWETFSVQTEEYWLAEMKDDRRSDFEKWRYGQALGKVRAARLLTDRTKLIAALMFTDIPGWQETVRYRQDEFRQQMFNSWFETFNGFRVFSYVAQANPSMMQIQEALTQLKAANEQHYRELGEKIVRLRQASWTWGSDFNMHDEPKSLLEYTLARDENHCRIASNMYIMSGRSDTQANVAAGALFVASFWLPTQVVVPLFLGVTGYSAWKSNEIFNSEREMFLSFLNETDTFTPGEQVLLKLSEKQFNELMIPLVLLGLPKAVRNINAWLRI